MTGHHIPDDVLQDRRERLQRLAEHEHATELQRQRRDVIRASWLGRQCLPTWATPSGISETATPGQFLQMGDGSIWFHPFTGAAPINTRKARGFQS
jgi:hypothetical protein